MALLFIYSQLRKTKWEQFYELRRVSRYTVWGEVRSRTARDHAAKFWSGDWAPGREPESIHGELVEVNPSHLADMVRMEKPQYRLTALPHGVYAFESTAHWDEFLSWPKARGEE